MTKTKIVRFILGGALATSLAVGSFSILAEPTAQAPNPNDQSVLVTQTPNPDESGNPGQPANTSPDQKEKGTGVTPNTPNDNTTIPTTNEGSVYDQN